jgi:hypothetical protein|tara:strand:- start:49 stop:669 length:621 start_codon:yes stop_codon:yes gene_type:complete
MPWAGILYPTTDQKLLDMIQGKDKSVRYLNKQWYKTSPDIVKLAQFIIDHRTKMKFRLQQKYAIFYSDKSLAQLLVETFWEHWYGSESVNPKYNKLGKNSIGCRRLPHGKFQYQVHLKKDVHQHISKQERESLWAYLERNENDCLVSNKYVLDYLIGKYPHCYHGYFYVSEQKMLTPIFMLAQGAIDKVIKYVQVKNAGNKKVKRS